MSVLDFSLDFPRAYGAVDAIASFRSAPEDFQVTEVLGFEPLGEGEHVYLYIQKQGENTAWVAEQIAHHAQVKPMDVGYCGRKDRHAITWQWFSVYLPTQVEPDWRQLNSESIQIIKVSRHVRKLRRGEHQANRFLILLTNLRVKEIDTLNKKIEKVFAQGVPNYFGEQRFGHHANNLHEAQVLLVDGKESRDQERRDKNRRNKDGRNNQKRGLILSAARSYLFNLVLAERVKSGNWNQCVEGEPDHEPSGPLWGRGRSLASGALLALEQNILSEWSSWCHSLEHMGLSQERRALVLRPSSCHYEWRGNSQLILGFTLEAGAFATALLYELCELENLQQQKEQGD